jgi:hypothetical protein
MATCVERARWAVEEEEAIALIGPVASGCTKQVLAANLQVPILSTLSTAKDLGDEKGWLFRTIAHDQRRLKTFVDTARGRGLDIDNSIAIYKPSVYGQGLLRHLESLVTGLDAAHTFAWDDVIEGFSHDEVTLSEAFRQAMQGHDHAIANVFVLGSSDRMDLVLQSLDRAFASTESDPSFVLVGSTRFADDLPEDTWLIGEAQVHTSQNLISDLTEDNPPGDLYISTLDASIALKEAIQYVLSQPGSNALPPAEVRTPAEVRRAVRRALEQNRFPSSERDRWVEFVSGEVIDPPRVPIYRVAVERRAQIINPDHLESWVEVRVVRQPAGHFEGPVVVELIPHGNDLVGEEVSLQIEGLGDEPIPIQEVELGRHATRVSFVPSFFRASWFPDAFTISTDRTPALERATVERLSWPTSYLFAALSALFGVLLYTRHTTRPATQEDKREEGARSTEGDAYPETDSPAVGDSTGAEGDEAEGNTEAEPAEAESAEIESAEIESAEIESAEEESAEARKAGTWMLWTYAERCIAGIAIAFLIIHVGPLLEGEPLLSQIPIPQFGSSVWLNAGVSGLMGGWLGLGPIIGLIAGVIGALTPLFQSDS